MTDVFEAIRQSEGFRPQAAWDYKQHSNGYGTRAQFPGEAIDKDEAERRLQAEVGKAQSIVDDFSPNLDPGTRAALTSLTYNAGDEWTRSGLGQAIKAGDMAQARDLFTQYNRAGGEVNPGLVARRQREVAWMGAPATQPERAGEPQGSQAPTGASTQETQPAASPGQGNRNPARFGQLGAGLAEPQPTQPEMVEPQLQIPQIQRRRMAAMPLPARMQLFGRLGA